ncbi:uridine diphosphate glucose pyrophosphatase NUDT14-like [Wyeomyia smithii]|uniref:uridine diphosphate glucose pyrophosphatase NUDT14-like n=1 Tax=Wyeomyia smithii TaxID=174621 RepID=UPI002468164A|nr:uridine diphosphate glucose pyrophosphatase NUDT14-like [Wyeomyia smithii]
MSIIKTLTQTRAFHSRPSAPVVFGAVVVVVSPSSTRAAVSCWSRHRKNTPIWTVQKRTMNDISNIRYGPLPRESPYVKPFRFHYTQNGKEKSWDLLKVHDSVSIIVFNVTRQRLVFVRQFRPAVYYNLVSAEAGDDGSKIDMQKYPPSIAVTLELCAGIVDKPISMAEIAREEVLEECGYNVPLERLEEIVSYRAGVGTSGALQTLFYAEVNDADRVPSGGGGVDDEMIDVVECSLDEARKMTQKGSNMTSPPSFLFGVLWFLTNRAPKPEA